MSDEAAAWASATFTGARHELALIAAPPGRAERWARALPETDLPLPGHLVADLRIVAADATADRLALTIEVLTVESA